ncbi:alpha/beta hydrolase family esterase [Saccharopolyspora sp. MS10]|uniref:alpha/beta hydrolase family esterase n=1 Tax=Saccharopolyspora sp. MS10 TaxID=3385973 RepID=UPI0039A174CF
MHRAVLSLLVALGAVAATAAPAHAAPTPERHSPRGGCGADPAVEPGTTTAQRVTSGGLTREYLVHLPEDYDSRHPLPVVLSFHGHGRTAEYQEELSRFSEEDAIAVYPQGLIGTDGKSAWQGAPYSADADDVRFTEDLLDRVRADFCTDQDRIYAAGKSNGGGFTNVLACRLGDRIAAFAPVAGAYYPQSGECSPDEPVPMISFHGTADATIPYEGNPTKGLPAIPDWLDGWAERDRCDSDPVTEHPGNRVTRQEWTDCAGRGELVHYRIDELGHDWPSRSSNPDSDEPTVIDATPLIWEFFQDHPKDS